MEPIFPFFQDRSEYRRGMPRMTDLHLYTGSVCNRSCDFCIVYGEPKGWYAPLNRDQLETAMQLIAPQGNVKFYGGEPTLDAENILWAISHLRQLGFEGCFTIFSNGIQARRIIRILEADDRCEVSLNYSILHGEGAEPIPAGALELLREFDRQHPGRIFSSHPDIVPIGRGFDSGNPAGRGDFSGSCPRCRPVVTTRGKLHACPFAVEFESSHYDLGRVGDAPEALQANYRSFLNWVDEVLEPAAQQRGVHPCEVCHKHRDGLPDYRQGRSESG